MPSFRYVHADPDLPVFSTMQLPLCSTAYATIPRPYAPALSSFLCVMVSVVSSSSQFRL
jgi:hypothetical protein